MSTKSFWDIITKSMIVVIRYENMLERIFLPNNYLTIIWPEGNGAYNHLSWLEQTLSCYVQGTDYICEVTPF